VFWTKQTKRGIPTRQFRFPRVREESLLIQVARLSVTGVRKYNYVMAGGRRECRLAVSRPDIKASFPLDDDLGRDQKRRKIYQRYRDPIEIIEERPLRKKK
jgi:hypothetical protein